jgi:hypothetical protein
VELGEVARWTFRDDAAAAAGPSALLLELSSWIEEAQLLGPLGAGATLYMEHSSEVNDTAGAEEGAAPDSQLVTVWYRAQQARSSRTSRSRVVASN